MNMDAVFSRTDDDDENTRYRVLCITNIILKLCKDDKVEDFHLSTNNKKFGLFGDIVIEIKYVNKNTYKIYAIKLAYTRNELKNVTTTHLTEAQGEFSISKCFESYHDHVKKMDGSIQMVLFTNSKLNSRKALSLILNDRKCDVNISSDFKNDHLNTSTEGSCYVLNSKMSQYKDFFSNFSLYADQAKATYLEKSSMQVFTDKSGSGKSSFRQYASFVTNWYMRKETKIDLDKTLITNLITLVILSPYMKILSFSDEVPITENGRTFREAVSKFHVTVLSSFNAEKIKHLWFDTMKDVDMEELNAVNVCYQITSDRITCTENMTKDEQKNMNKLLWLLGKCPLVIDDCVELGKILHGIDKKNIVVLTTLKNNSGVKNLAHNRELSLFENLSNLRKEESLYYNILNTYMFSLQGQRRICLKGLSDMNDEIDTWITTDNLVEMLEHPLQIGKEVDILPSCLISRTLTTVVIDAEFLQRTQSNYIIISDVKDEQAFTKHLRNTQVSENGTKITFRGKVNSNVIHLHKYQFSQDEFNNWCLLNKTRTKCHQFRYLDTQSLEWIRSNTDMDELMKFRVDHKYNYTIHESQLFDNCENSINIVCADPDMGKTTLVKSLKNSSSSSIWTIIIYTKNSVSTYRQMGENVNIYLKKLCKCEEVLEEKVFELLINTRRIRILWDGLDEVSDKSRQTILKTVELLSKKGFKQWITVRNNLKDLLEEAFNTFSREIREFDEKDQQRFIKERLGLSNEELVQLFKKIKSNILIVHHNIFKIPLQIYMLTKLFAENFQKYLDLLDQRVFTTLNLYEYFINEKFAIYHKDELKYDIRTNEGLQKCQSDKRQKINFYKNVAYDLYLNEEFVHICNLFCSSKTVPKKILDTVKRSGDPVGFFQVNVCNEPEFIHKSYGEYFAALYLFQNNPNQARNESFIKNPEYDNVRFFLDLMLAQDSKTHVALLSKSYKLLMECTNLDCLDKIKRKPLELSCAWSKKYSFINNDITLWSNDTNIKGTSNLDYKSIARHFSKISTSLHSCVRKLMLLLPFLIPVYNKTYQHFEDVYLPTILYYAVKFDYAFIFTCNENIQWLQNIHTKIEPNKLISLIVTHNSRNCLQELISKKNYGDVLVRNFNFLLNVSNFKLYEYFSLLVETANDINASVYSAYKVKSETDIQRLLRKFVKINTPDANGRMLMHHASGLGDWRTTKILIDEGASINIPDEDGRTPLHYACKEGYYDIVKLLIEVGGEINAVDKEGQTPMHCACLKGNYYIVQLLLNNGAKADVLDMKGRKPLHHVSYNNEHYFKKITQLLSEWTNT